MIALLGSALVCAGCGETDSPVVPTSAPSKADPAGKETPKAPARRGAGR